jgi:DNA repair exonuclease SbcCD ATPase subunit
MFNAWRYSSQKKDGAENPKSPPQDSSDDAQVSQLRKMLEDLRGGLVDSQRHEPPATPDSDPPSAEIPVETSSVEQFETHVPNADFDQLTSVARLVAEQRKAAEAMLQEVAAFEEQLQAQTQMAEASQALGTASAKIEALREAELAAQAACEALLARRDQLQGLQTETDAELLAAKTRLSDAQQAAAELEKRLREALQHTHDAAALIERVEAESGELASSQAAVEGEISSAMERVQACRQETAVAQTEAESAREHVKALNVALASPSGDDPFTALQRLALRLAEDASTMAAAAEKKKVPKLLI